MTATAHRPGSSSTALRALRVLEVVAAEPRPLALGEVARLAAIDKSAAHRMLATLLAAGYVHRDPDSRRYALSYRVVSLSRNLLAENEVVRLARATLEAVSAETGEGVHEKYLALAVALEAEVQSWPLTAAAWPLSAYESGARKER